MISTERLVLRQWTEADREPWAELNADPIVMEFFPATLAREESDRAFDLFHARIERDGFGWFAAERIDTGELIGMIGLADQPDGLPISPCLEIGWRLKKDAWGHGFATEGARAALDFAFNTLGRDEVVSFTSLLNERSYRVMERLHMQRMPQTFEHPSVPKGHPLREHVVYKQTRQEWLAYRRAESAGFAISDGYLALGLYGNGPEMSDHLLDLIRSGPKRATTGLLWEYEHLAEALPEVGSLELVIDFDGHPQLVTRNTSVEVTPFNKVTEAFAAKEGEGDRSLEYWKRVHWDFFSRVCEHLGRTPSEDMPVVCTEFEVVHVFE